MKLLAKKLERCHSWWKRSSDIPNAAIHLRPIPPPRIAKALRQCPSTAATGYFGTPPPRQKAQ
jgi:hypothetical protein